MNALPNLLFFSGTQAQSSLVYHQFLPFSPTPALPLVYQSVSAILSYSSSSPSLTVQLFPFSPIPFSPTPALSLLSHSSYPPSLPVQFFPFSPIPVLSLLSNSMTVTQYESAYTEFVCSLRVYQWIKATFQRMCSWYKPKNKKSIFYLEQAY